MFSGSVSSGMGQRHSHPNPISCGHSENLGFDYRMEQLHGITLGADRKSSIRGTALVVKHSCPVCSEVHCNPSGYLPCSQNHPTRHKALLCLLVGSLVRPLLDLNDDITPLVTNTT